MSAHLHALLSDKLDEIAALYKERPRLTLIVRVPGKPDQGAFLSDDNWTEAVELVRYLQNDGTAYVAGPPEPKRESADGAERDALRQMWEDTDEPIHLWFGLSYASFFVMPRTVMQSMPADWQRRFIALIDESATTFPDWDANWNVTMRDERGRFVQDPLGDYERGRRRLTPGVPPRGEEA